MTMMQTDSFGELVLEKRVVAALKEMGFEEPSPIQQQAIPLLLEGRDIIGQAQTGTGKTAAFGIPIIQGIEDRRHIQALITSPTRELAIQIAEEVTKIGCNKRIKVVPVYGGQPIERQIRALKSGVQIVIGTPGRLLDHIRRGTIKLNHVRYLVLDEADEMLDMGFIEDMEEIMASVPSERQTMLFSATMPRPILSLTKKYMRAPQIVTVSKEEITVPLIDQYYFETRDKIEGISRLLDAGIEGKSIIGSNYPGDSAYNVGIVGKKCFLNKNVCDGTLYDILISEGYEIIQVNQGYTKCSICPIDENSFITGDVSIARAGENSGMEVLLISNEGISLPGYKNGFFGGCCGMSDENELLINGDSDLLSDSAKIKDFLLSKGITIKNLRNGEVIDIGSIIPLMTS